MSHADLTLEQWKGLSIPDFVAWGTNTNRQQIKAKYPQLFKKVSFKNIEAII